MSYQTVLNAVYVAATECADTRKPTQIRTRLGTRADVEQAFGEWMDTGGAPGVSMRVTENVRTGEVAAEFDNAHSAATASSRERIASFAVSTTAP